MSGSEVAGTPDRTGQMSDSRPSSTQAPVGEPTVPRGGTIGWKSTTPARFTGSTGAPRPSDQPTGNEPPLLGLAVAVPMGAGDAELDAPGIGLDDGGAATKRIPGSPNPMAVAIAAITAIASTASSTA